MANVLTGLTNDIYKAADRVGRELVGVLPSMTINADGSERAAIGQDIASSFTRQATAVDNVPSMTIPEGTDQTVDKKTGQITKSRSVQIPWNGEQTRFINGGPGYETVYGDQIAQAMRTLVNEQEVDAATAVYQGASRAIGTAGTTPFASNLNLMNEARKELVDNGCPDDGQWSFVMNTSAGLNMRNLTNLLNVNEAGDSSMLRNGVLGDISRFMIRESAGIVDHTKGDGTSYQTAAALAVGDSAVTADTGSGTLLAGDVLTFAADSDNKYVANTALAAGAFTLGTPGARVAIADNNAITIGNNYAANLAFHRSAAEFFVRPPAMPEGGDSAVDAMVVQDPFSGMVFEIRVYKGFQKAMITVGAAWGAKAWKPDNIIVAMG